MRQGFIAFLLMIGIGWTLPSIAQSPSDIPLTHEAFKGLTVEQAARRLIGSSSDLVSKMIIGLPPGYSGQPLSVIRFFSRPRGSEPGLCQQDEIDVLFETEDGSPIGRANASTRMKISELRSGHGYFVVGDLNTRFREQQRRDLEQICVGLENPLDFFPANSTREAWESAYLLDAALKEARSRDRQSLTIACKATECDDAYASLSKLSPNDIFSVKEGCNRPPDASNVCYSIRLYDSLSGYRSWLIYVESSRRIGVGLGPEVVFKSATFTLNPQPVI